MRIKQAILATLASGTVMWLLAGLWHKLIMAQFYTTETSAIHEGTGTIFIAYMILSAIMVYLFLQLKREEVTITKGLKFGAIIGLLWVFPHELAMAGAHGESIIYLFKNSAWHMLEQGIGGIVITYIYKAEQ